ncbi:MAG: hypothetical protein KKD73_07450 [Proteobacteria bacterium]|nr:hypothetical protein [Pseudomonadota bacterium]MBU1639591.1 hypothetical protein [Pseudomonadota bacterium]
MARLIDTTLREGEQTPGLYLSPTVKKQIFAGLARCGVDEIELGVATAANTDLAELCGYARDHFPRQPFSLWCRCKEEDIRLAATLSPAVLSLSIPASDLHLEKKLGRDRSWALTTVAFSVRLAVSLGIKKVALGLEDASRADRPFLRELAALAREAGAFRIRVADTVGIADPVMMAELVGLMAGNGLEVAVHCHNDFGMATANTLSAFRHGAKWGDVTILGLGERAGNSRLEEVLAYLVLQEDNPKYHLAEMLALCRQVARETGRQIPPHQPLLGTNIFICESGIHQQGILADPATYEPFAPERVGKTRKFLVGKGVGRHGLAATLERLHIPRPADGDLLHLWQRLRCQATQLHRPLHDQEIYQLAIEASTSS